VVCDSQARERWATGVLDFLVPIFPFAFPALWFGGGIVLFFRFRATQRAYLRRFPPVEPY
jgi:hypothetical protein